MIEVAEVQEERDALHIVERVDLGEAQACAADEFGDE